MNVITRFRISSNKCTVLVEASSLTNQVRVNVEMAKPFTQFEAMFSEHRFADVLAALTIGQTADAVHIEKLPEFCPCPECVGKRAELLARKIQEARNELAKNK